MIKGVSKEADHSCDQNSKTKTPNSSREFMKLRHRHGMDSLAAV